MTAVPLVFWNPRDAGRFRLVARVRPRGRRKDNFGDLIGPLVVAALGHEVERIPDNAARSASDGPRLLAVGSILRWARDGDVVWGTGVNGKSVGADHAYRHLDVRAVRGPQTQAFLRGRGIDVPDVFGDPALLLPLVRPDLLELARGDKRHAVTVIPNLNDVAAHADHPDFLSPCAPIETVLRRIAQSERVVGSALHGTVVAEALGVPAFSVRSGVESPLKYTDYFEGTGRPGHPVFDTLADALTAPALDGPDWSAGPLLDAFPDDLWPATRAVPVEVERCRTGA